MAEAAATGALDPHRGQRIVCFVLLKSGFEPSDELADELREFVADKIGKIARPAAVLFGDDLPKTRSGKIMRRLLRNIAEGDELGRHDDAPRPRDRRGPEAEGRRGAPRTLTARATG